MMHTYLLKWPLRFIEFCFWSSKTVFFPPEATYIYNYTLGTCCCCWYTAAVVSTSNGTSPDCKVVICRWSVAVWSLRGSEPLRLWPVAGLKHTSRHKHSLTSLFRRTPLFCPAPLMLVALAWNRLLITQRQGRYKDCLCVFIHYWDYSRIKWVSSHNGNKSRNLSLIQPRTK